MIMSLFQCSAQDGAAIRKPVVAGSFYSANPEKLRSEVNDYLSKGKKRTQYPSMLISPHAGYIYSGPVAGMGFAAIDRKISKVILIGPSHRKAFEGLSIPDVTAYETPLGLVNLAKNDIKILRADPMVHAYPDAHDREHCIEVQLPFLQVMLNNFSIVPIITGRVNPEAAAKLIRPLIDKQTLVVISSDFSHYHPHAEAKKLDSASVESILCGNTHGDIDACGELPIRIAISLANTLGLSPELIDMRNSFETFPESGRKQEVVGYASIAYFKKDSKTAPDRSAANEKKMDTTDSFLLQGDKEFLLTLARSALENAVNNLDPPSPSDIPASCLEKCGCFVTLTINGDLRGCIGYLEGIKPLYRAVIENAKNAALGDPRFPDVTPGETESIRIEVSVLTKPENLEFAGPDDLLAKLVCGRDGLILAAKGRQSTFLPQVWDQIPGKKEFLEHLSMKAGLEKNAWKQAAFKRYFAIHFEEE
jgi:AmmeMemoRadiSam system protein B/AmmeMemoRadiSam system protein A